jgi:hypothetical protein
MSFYGMLNNMLLNVDFTPIVVDNSSAMYQGMAIGLGIGATLILFGFLGSVELLKGWKLFLTIPLGLLPISIGIFLVACVIPQGGNTPSEDDRVVALQDWAEDKYLVVLDAADAQFLLENQVDLTDSVADAVLPLTVKDSYGDLVEVKLVHTGEKKWELTKVDVDAVVAE